jgi:hypothetical protein
MLKKGKHSSETKSKQSMAQSPVTISHLEKKKRKPVNTPDLVPPCKRTTRSMEKKGKTIFNPHKQDPIDVTSPSDDLSVQDDIPSLTEEQATITLCGMREEVEERACIQPTTIETTKALTKEQMKKNIGEVQKQN